MIGDGKMRLVQYVIGEGGVCGGCVIGEGGMCDW